MGATRVDQNHNQLFTEEDEQKATALKLAIVRELRRRKMTYAQFSQLYIDCYLNKGYSRPSIITDRNNTIKSLLTKKTLSYAKFAEILRDILRVNLVALTFTVMDEDGNTHDIKTEVKTF